MQERAIWRRLAAAQAFVERGSIAWCLNPERRGEVELIDVAGTNPVVNGRDARGVLLLIEVELGFKMLIG